MYGIASTDHDGPIYTSGPVKLFARGTQRVASRFPLADWTIHDTPIVTTSSLGRRKYFSAGYFLSLFAQSRSAAKISFNLFSRFWQN